MGTQPLEHIVTDEELENESRERVNAILLAHPELRPLWTRLDNIPLLPCEQANWLLDTLSHSRTGLDAWKTLNKFTQRACVFYKIPAARIFFIEPFFPPLPPPLVSLFRSLPRGKLIGRVITKEMLTQYLPGNPPAVVDRYIGGGIIVIANTYLLNLSGGSAYEYASFFLHEFGHYVQHHLAYGLLHSVMLDKTKLGKSREQAAIRLAEEAAWNFKNRIEKQCWVNVGENNETI